MQAIREEPPVLAYDSQPPTVVVSASMDNLASADVRFVQEAARLGSVHVRLWSDGLVASRTGGQPVFPQAERRFLAQSLRYVERVSVVGTLQAAARPLHGAVPTSVLVQASADDPELRATCAARGIEYRVLAAGELGGFPGSEAVLPAPADSRRVVVTGCFDWLHSGHVQFFLDAASLGQLHVVIGSDRNVRHLKGRGHPLRGQDERRYMVHAVRVVHRALISSGHGWLDAEPEIEGIAPHIYAVNEDGDQPEKRDFCRAHGLEYVVLRRRPHRGLPKRTSTAFRGY